MDLQYLEQKVESNPASPLFARLAGEYLSSGEREKAIEVSVNGLRRYPDYPTAHLILAKCYADEGHYATALEQIRAALEILPCAPPLLDLKIEWERKLRDHLRDAGQLHAFAPPDSPTDIEDETDDVADTLEPIADIPSESNAVATPPVRGEHESDMSGTPEFVNTVQSAEILETPPAVILSNDLLAPSEIALSEDFSLPGGMDEMPAERIPEETSNSPGYADLEPHTFTASDTRPPDELPPATLPEPQPVVVEELAMHLVNDDRRIVSKTLAEIYATQGEYGEAIMTYRLLKRDKPSMADTYDKRIEELEAMERQKQAL